MNVIAVRLNKDKLITLPDAERVFFIGLGHISNEINAITKMLYWSAGTPQRNNAEINGQRFLTLFLMKILSGKLFESWNLFQKLFFGSGISKDYDPELEGEPKEALEKLKKYFGKDNSISTIRNNFGFHYSPKEVDEMLLKIDGNFDLYMERENFQNNLFFFSELLEEGALIDAIGFEIQDGDMDGILVNLSGELFDVGIWFLIASDGLMDLIIGKFGEEIREGEPTNIEFDSMQSFNKVYLPWFTQVTESDTMNFSKDS